MVLPLDEDEEDLVLPEEVEEVDFVEEDLEDIFGWIWKERRGARCVGGAGWLSIFLTLRKN